MTETNNNGHNEIPENERSQEEKADLVAEFAALGKKFGEAFATAWNSEERHQLQSDLKEGLDRFTVEVNEATKKVRESETGKKVESGVQKAAADIKKGKAVDEVKRGMLTALRGLSDALDRMAASFTPVEEEETPQE